MAARSPRWDARRSHSTRRLLSLFPAQNSAAPPAGRRTAEWLEDRLAQQHQQVGGGVCGSATTSSNPTAAAMASPTAARPAAAVVAAFVVAGVRARRLDIATHSVHLFLQVKTAYRPALSHHQIAATANGFRAALRPRLRLAVLWQRLARRHCCSCGPGRCSGLESRAGAGAPSHPLRRSTMPPPNITPTTPWLLLSCSAASASLGGRWRSGGCPMPTATAWSSSAEGDFLPALCPCPCVSWLRVHTPHHFVHSVRCCGGSGLAKDGQKTVRPGQLSPFDETGRPPTDASPTTEMVGGAAVDGRGWEPSEELAAAVASARQAASRFTARLAALEDSSSDDDVPLYKRRAQGRKFVAGISGRGGRSDTIRPHLLPHCLPHCS